MLRICPLSMSCFPSLPWAGVTRGNCGTKGLKNGGNLSGWTWNCCCLLVSCREACAFPAVP